MKTSATTKLIFPALVAALHEIESASKDGKSEAFKRNNQPFKYTTLDAVIEASKPVLKTHDLGLMQWPGELQDGKLTLETVIIHKSGEWVSGDFQIALGKVDPQGVGSALTYARRYAQKAALNISDEDDDAEGHKKAVQPDVLTEAQVDQLIDLAEEVGADKRRFLTHMKAASFKEIKPAQFKDAIAALEQKRQAPSTKVAA